MMASNTAGEIISDSSLTHKNVYQVAYTEEMAPDNREVYRLLQN
jgi:hypothetical protein